MFRFFVRIALVSLVAAGLVFLWLWGGQFLLERFSEKALLRTERSLSALGVRLGEVDVDSIKFEWPLAARWEGVSFRVSAEEDSAVARRAGFDVSVEAIRFAPQSILKGIWRIRAEGLACRSIYVELSEDSPAVGGLWLSADYFERDVALDPRQLKGDVEAEYRSLVALLNEGSVAGRFELSGSFGFNFEGSPVSIRFKHEERGDKVGLRANPKDVASLAALYSIELTPAEIEVVSKYPIQAPSMLRLQRYATNTSKAAADRSASVPQDAYRHVLWSYLLTLKFGVELAEEITDAHELGSTTNTPADHRMDYHNNRIGRKYAIEGRREGEILQLTKTDPEVIRYPR